LTSIFGRIKLPCSKQFEMPPRDKALRSIELLDTPVSPELERRAHRVDVAVGAALAAVG
jgi:hypothetical protein